MEEFQLLKTLFNKLEPRFISLPSGPGDDCAIIASTEKILVSQDVLVEGIHFKQSWSSPRDIAWKALATNESDIASMGGRPIGYTIGLVVPVGYANIIEELYSGFNEYLLERESQGFFQKILGGDISSGQCFSISVSVIGECHSPILRSGANLNDLLVVSGPIGLAGLGLGILNGLNPENLTEIVRESALRKHKRPNPRTDLGSFLSSNKLATSMIDISDGLVQDVMHLARESGLCALLEPNTINYPPTSCRADLVSLLTAGDDYELLFTLPSFEDFNLVKEKFPEIFIVGEMIAKGSHSVLFLADGKQITLEQFVGTNVLTTGYRHTF